MNRRQARKAKRSPDDLPPEERPADCDNLEFETYPEEFQNMIEKRFSDGIMLNFCNAELDRVRAAQSVADAKSRFRENERRAREGATIRDAVERKPKNVKRVRS